MRFPWQKNKKDTLSQKENQIQAQKIYIYSLFSINKEELQRMKKAVKEFFPTFTEVAIINNFTAFFHPKLGIDIPEIRIIFEYVIYRYKSKNQVIFFQKFSQLKIDERYEKLLLLKIELLEALNDVFIPKSLEKGTNYIQETVQEYFNLYIE